MNNAVDPTPTDWNAPAMKARLRKRYAAERRFKLFGLAAVVMSAAFLAFLLVTMASQGWRGFTRAEVALPIDFKALALPVDRNQLGTPGADLALAGAELENAVKSAAVTAFGPGGDGFISDHGWIKVRDAIKADPLWKDGNYTDPPAAGLRTAASLTMIAGANPYALQAQYPTREAAEIYKDEAFARTYGRNDANDTIYQLDSSRTYNPWPNLEKIRVPVLWINSADDFINPPAYGITEKAAARMKTAMFILIPASPETKGHSTHTWAKFWKDDLARLMAE